MSTTHDYPCTLLADISYFVTVIIRMGYWHIIFCTRDVFVKRSLWPVKKSLTVKSLRIWFVEPSLTKPAIVAYMRDSIHCVSLFTLLDEIQAGERNCLKKIIKQRKGGQLGLSCVLHVCSQPYTHMHTPVCAWTGMCTHTGACVRLMLTLCNGWRNALSSSASARVV